MIKMGHHVMRLEIVGEDCDQRVELSSRDCPTTSTHYIDKLFNNIIEIIGNNEALVYSATATFTLSVREWERVHVPHMCMHACMHA